MSQLRPMETGILHLIPTPLTGASIQQLSAESISACCQLQHFCVERAKTARHFIKSIQHPLPLANLTVLEIPQNNPGQLFAEIIQDLLKGNSYGLLSEAGLPCIADPGQELVALAHHHAIIVKPYAGPNSMLMALMASGFNGQHFQFHGYLPAKKEGLKHALVQILTLARKTGQAQIFMETPYRNKQVFETLIHHIPSDMKVCVASSIGGPDEFIQSYTIKKLTPALYSRHLDKPSIFILGSLHQK